ncbi:arginine:agmatine antiporter [Bifidobacterium dolichotidis]|uniref:Arginine:agmatine antiporter n=2 Tax=Bifidobacterium dolichotidis TaxID=2306976 RepID=A0A430FRZ0_9BIFI|nr:arginine:agmatine antiporter [Bifidobacterium dolichotidis]
MNESAPMQNNSNIAAAAASQTMESNEHKHSGAAGKVGLLGLTAVVISAMVGGGVFELPQNMAMHASAGGQILAWIITGLGMWFIADTFRVLAAVRPEYSDGLYSYAYHGFGRFVGFLVSYGYWATNTVSLVAYGILITSTLDFFFPGVFTGGTTIPAILVQSLVLWATFFMGRLGIRSGARINVAGTIAKLIPLALFVVTMIVLFRMPQFVHGFWGWTPSGQPAPFDLSSVYAQSRQTMLVTLWVFNGVEGAVVVSANARSQRDVSRATTIGFISILVLYMLVSLLPLGVYAQPALAKLPSPSVAAILGQIYGAWGEWIVNAGVIVSVLFAMLVWLLMLSQMPLNAARDGLMPSFLAQTDSNGTPRISMLYTVLICQFLCIACHYIEGSAWNLMISIVSVLSIPCYLCCAMYLWRISRRDHIWPINARFTRKHGLVIGVLGTFYMLYAAIVAGLDYVMAACIVYAIGTPLFVFARHRANTQDAQGKLFTRAERIMLVLIVIAGIAGVIYVIMTRRV